MLEECGLPFTSTFIDILAGDQLRAEFLALSPNNKHPVIVDPDGPAGRPITVWESGAILIYLAEKCGKLIPSDPERRIETLLNRTIILLSMPLLQMPDKFCGRQGLVRTARAKLSNVKCRQTLPTPRR